MGALGYLVAFLAIVSLIIVHEWGHFQVARWCRMRVERFSIFFGPVLWSHKRKDTIYQIGSVPLGGFVQITGMNPAEEFDRSDPRVYPNRPVWQRLLTIFAGPGANYLTAVLIGVFVFSYYGLPVPTDETEIQGVLAGKPAAKAGLQAGDVVVSVDGQPLTKEIPMTDRIKASAGKSVTLRVQRPVLGTSGQPIVVDGKPQRTTLDLPVTPENDGGTFRIGVQIGAGQRFERKGFGNAVAFAVRWPYEFSKQNLKAIGELLSGKQKPEVSGPVRITAEIKKSIDRGLQSALLIIMNLSIYLGLFNLLPVPALDGGRLVFLGFELISRRRVNQRVEASVHMVGFVALFLLMIVVLFKDIFIG